MIRSFSQVAMYLGLFCPKQGYFTQFSIDSRLTGHGELYVALRGQKVDGHAFLDEVAKKGAVGAIVEKGYQGKDFGLTLFRVDDPLKALQQLAKAEIDSNPHRKVIGVTGSVGKTTTKEFLATLLEGKYKVVKTPGNYNTKVTLPLTILNHAQGDEDYIVLEMGMTEAGEISRLVQIAPPHIALVTSVALQHAMNFSSLSAIAQAKGEIFSHPKTQVGIFPKELPDYSILAGIGSCKKVTFSTVDSTADYFLEKLENFPFKGRHLLHNFLGACAVAEELGMTAEDIIPRLSFLKTPELRQQRVEKRGVVFINDAYNSSEPALKAALDCLPEPSYGGKTIAVLGEIRELGAFSKEVLERVAEACIEKLDDVICIGEGMGPFVEKWKKSGKPIRWAQSHGEILRELNAILQAGDVVLLKGSKYFRLWEILDGL